MNKELEEYIKSYNELKEHKSIIKNIDTDFFFKTVDALLLNLENSIPKEVIENKIEEYKKEGFEYENKICTMYYKKQNEIDTLQELLEGK